MDETTDLHTLTDDNSVSPQYSIYHHSRNQAPNLDHFVISYFLFCFQAALLSRIFSKPSWVALQRRPRGEARGNQLPLPCTDMYTCAAGRQTAHRKTTHSSQQEQNKNTRHPTSHKKAIHCESKAKQALYREEQFFSALKKKKIRNENYCKDQS